MRLKKGDTIRVISGKDKGKKGKILEALITENKVIVERINIVKRHMKATREFQGGIIEKPAALSIAKVMLLCPSCDKPSRLRKQNKVRICARCGESVDKVK
ncbi:MAG: 50S ribosomal protein L24 [bacterium]